MKRAKCLISFADSTYGHSGTIYKAAGWIFDGIVKPDYHYVGIDGWKMHKRTLWSHSSKMKMSEKEYATKFGFEAVFGGEKFRYLFPLNHSLTLPNQPSILSNCS